MFCFDTPNAEMYLVVLVAALLGTCSFLMGYIPNRDAAHAAEEEEHREHEANKRRLHAVYLEKKAKELASHNQDKGLFRKVWSSVIALGGLLTIREVFCGVGWVSGTWCSAT